MTLGSAFAPTEEQQESVLKNNASSNFRGE
jgi:hypothetical protein